MPGGYVCSASMKGTLGKSDAHIYITGEKPLRKLFSKEQRAFYEEHAPAGIDLDDLSVLGPIFVLKAKFSPKGMGRRMVAEVWLYPDDSRILELSTKCAPDEMRRSRQRGQGVPHLARHHPDRRAADEDAQGARVLLGTHATGVATRPGTHR